MIRKICPYCKADNPEEAVFCKKCGALFQGESEFVNLEEKKEKKALSLKNKIIVAVCIVLLLIALVVFKSGSVKEEEVINTPTASVVQTDSSSTPTASATDSAVTEVSTTTTTTTVTTTVAAPVTTTTTTAPSTTAAPKNDAASICADYNNLIHNVKKRTDSFSVHKTEKIALEITEFSLPVDTATINNFMMKLIPETDKTYKFVGGVCPEDSKTTLNTLIPPANEFESSVSPDDLLSAPRDANGTITLKFKPDSSSFADGKTNFPLYVGSATDVLDFATFSLGPVKITKAEIEYPATEIKAEVDSEGNLKKLTVIQPVNTTATGGVGALTADVGMNLKATTTFEIR